MTVQQKSSHPKPLPFKVEASRCDLVAGDSVTPDTLVGLDHETGKEVRAGCRGRVLAVNFSGGDHSLLVVIEPVAP